jgi:hypothetical protein
MRPGQTRSAGGGGAGCQVDTCLRATPGHGRRRRPGPRRRGAGQVRGADRAGRRLGQVELATASVPPYVHADGLGRWSVRELERELGRVGPQGSGWRRENRATYRAHHGGLGAARRVRRPAGAGRRSGSTGCRTWPAMGPASVALAASVPRPGCRRVVGVWFTPAPMMRPDRGGASQRGQPVASGSRPATASSARATSGADMIGGDRYSSPQRRITRGEHDRPPAAAGR